MHALNKFIHSFAIIRKKKKFVQSVLGTACQKNVLRITKVSYCFALGNVLCQKDSSAPLLDPSHSRNSTVC